MSSRTLRRGVLVTLIAGLLAARGIGLDARAQAAAQAAPEVVARFARDPNPIALRGPARPERYMEASGRKAALLGREDGSFEAWVYPLKVLHDFHLSFGTPDYADPIPGVHLASARRRAAGGQRGALRARGVHGRRHLARAAERSGRASSCSTCTTSQPLQVVVKFRPDLKPMWPAALGGQYSYWDAGQKAYVLGRGERQALGDDRLAVRRSIRPSSPPTTCRTRRRSSRSRSRPRPPRAAWCRSSSRPASRGLKRREGDLSSGCSPRARRCTASRRRTTGACARR